MARTVYVNGEYLDEHLATVSVFDRGFLFADAVYEVTAVIGGKLWDINDHLSRLANSCAGLSLPCPWTTSQLIDIHRQLIDRNGLDEGVIYLQLTRGSNGDRHFSYADFTADPTLVMFTQALPLIDIPAAGTGIRMVTRPDIRWQRRDLKTVSLLPASMARTWARQHGADDALFVENGMVTEGSASNVFMVTGDNTVVTRPLGTGILPGTTRRLLTALIEHQGLTLAERLFTPDEMRRAREVFISATTELILPVVEIDGVAVGDGVPGNISRALRAGLIRQIQDQEE